MGNCQAVDNATLVIQHPNGKVDKMYSPVSANHVMKMNPGHYVALLLTTTTTYSPATATHTTVKNDNIPLRVTRIKLLRPTDTLVLGHVYRLVTSQEVMKGLRARKQGQMKQKQQQSEHAEKYGKMMTDKQVSDFEAVIKKTVMVKSKQVKQERHRPRNNNNNTVNSGVSKSRAWQPSLKSISEAGS